MDYEKYMSMPNAQVPREIEGSLQDGGNIHLTAFEDKNDILTDAALQMETGFGKMDNGDYLVSMYCPMPGVARHCCIEYRNLAEKLPQLYGEANGE